MKESITTIIFVDDDKDICDIFKDLFEDEYEHKVVTFTSTVEALKYANSHKEEVKLIISDFRVPELNGLDFYKKLENSKVSFVLISGMMLDENDKEIQIFAAGKKHLVMNKPVDEDALISKINSLKLLA